MSPLTRPDIDVVREKSHTSATITLSTCYFTRFTASTEVVSAARKDLRFSYVLNITADRDREGDCTLYAKVTAFYTAGQNCVTFLDYETPASPCIHCVSIKNTPDIFHGNSSRRCWILIIFATNVL